MSTSNVTNGSPGTLHSLAATARGLFVGLCWAALMFLIAGLWMGSKYGDASKFQRYTFLLAGAGAAALAAWQGFTLWFKKESPDEKATTLGQQRRLFSLVFLAGGLGLVVLAIVLGFGKKSGNTYGFVLDNLGESIGVLFFGLASLAAGYALSTPTTGESSSPLQFLTQKIPLLKFLVLALAVLALGTFVWIVWTNRVENRWTAYLPELFALVGVSVLCMACFFWLNTGVLDEFGVRLFVLVFGGVFGLILFCYSIGRVVVWWQDIVLGGLAAWQGENAWRFWTCVYLQFGALVLMFVSFNLAKADIRTNVYLRRVMYGYDTILQTLLLLQILAVVNIVLYALAPFTFDWTKARGAYALSDSSKNLIANLKKETNIVVLMSPNDAVYRDVRNLMDNYQANSNKLKVEYLSPDSDPYKYNALLQKFPKIQPTEDPRFGGAGRGVLLVNGPIPADKKDNPPPYAFVSAQKFTDVERDPRGDPKKTKSVFKGEGEITKELQFLLQEKKRKIYILQGNDEPDMHYDEPAVRPEYRDSLLKTGLSVFVEKLNTDNYEVFGLSFAAPLGLGKEPPKDMVYLKADGSDKKKEIPKDCDTLIVPQAAKALPDDIVAAIERYMERDGKLMVLLDVIAESDFSKLRGTGLERMMKTFGVEVLDGFALSLPPRGNDPSLLVALGADRSEHVLARQFTGRSILMPDSARVLKAADAPGRFKAQPVLQFEFRERARHTLVETDIRPLQRVDLNLHLLDLDKANQLGARVNHEPVIVGVAVAETEGGRPRMVVLGDTEFLGNRSLRTPTRQLNYDFAASCLEWMGERESIGARPKVTPTFTLDPSVDSIRMILLPFWIMLLTLIGLGVGIWVARRR